MANHNERRHYEEYTEEELDDLAHKLYPRLQQKFRTQFYEDVGKAVVTKSVWLFGTVVSSIMAWVNWEQLTKLLKLYLLH